MTAKLTRTRWWMVLGAAALAIVVAAVLVLTTGGTEPSGDTRDGRAAGTPADSSGASDTSSPDGTTPPPSTSLPSAPPASTGSAPSTPPAGGVPASLRGQDVTVLPTTRRIVALTFDAGANSAGLASILATLADRHVPATFFLTGAWVEGNRPQASAILAAGHRVGNHSTTHPHLPALSDQAIRDEVRGAEDRIRAAGADPRPLFRFPFGDRDARTIAAVNDLGYVAVRWTVDTLGWQGTSGGRSAQQVADRAVAALQPGAIVLMHIGANPDDGSTLDADALPGMISRMRAAGYEFVTLDELLAH